MKELDCCYLVPPPPSYHGHIESHEKCHNSCQEHLEVFPVIDLASDPGITALLIFFRNKGTVNIKLISCLDYVVDENKDENEVPGLTKDTILELF